MKSARKNTSDKKSLKKSDNPLEDIVITNNLLNDELKNRIAELEKNELLYKEKIISLEKQIEIDQSIRAKNTYNIVNYFAVNNYNCDPPEHKSEHMHYVGSYLMDHVELCSILDLDPSSEFVEILKENKQFDKIAGPYSDDESSGSNDENHSNELDESERKSKSEKMLSRLIYVLYNIECSQLKRVPFVFSNDSDIQSDHLDGSEIDDQLDQLSDPELDDPDGKMEKHENNVLIDQLNELVNINKIEQPIDRLNESVNKNDHLDESKVKSKKNNNTKVKKNSDAKVKNKKENVKKDIKEEIVKKEKKIKKSEK